MGKLGKARRKARDMVNGPLVAETRHYVVPFLRELGVTETKINRVTVRQAYSILYNILAKRLGRRIEGINSYYWLWTNGIPLDGLKTMEPTEVESLLKLIWANKAQQK